MTPGRKSANRIAPSCAAEHAPHWIVVSTATVSKRAYHVCVLGLFINGYSVDDPPSIRGAASKLQFLRGFGIGQDTMGDEEREKGDAYC